uniref:F-ATPase protein 6 n=1 Tax=Metastrongylus pudendotectus TaxID=55275 RepID=D3J837_METPU|nr:ATP synthase F0 subunit 6 [Metastrongylus pudendotectus]ACX85136.1 ATP synthase F0 subunit 6 [Metastrongylus pudendotectus]
MNELYFFDVFLFLYLLHFVYFMEKDIFVFLFFKKLNDLFSMIFGYLKDYSMSYIISFFTLMILLLFCFGGYFSYSLCVCSMLEFTLSYSLVAWLTTIFLMVSGFKFSVYLSKVGDVYLKSFSMMMVEIVSELSRPLALTIRLTVNITVGHLIIGFLYYGLEFFFGELFVFLYIFSILMECFVFFIQSYIFSRLIYLYLNE